MKRDARLQGLSSEHHQALVLARTLVGRRGAWSLLDGQALLGRYERELEPHFRSEEGSLLPALRRAGASELVDRTTEDHAFLRAKVAAAAGGDGDAARAFGERLHDHVRFEERELFPACEALGGDVLDELSRRTPTKG